MDYDKSSAEQRQTDAQVAEVRATIQRKVIRAPFSGILGIRKVNLGQYLSAGAPVVPLQSLNPIYVNFAWCALVFSAANAALLAIRIRAENAALIGNSGSGDPHIRHETSVAPRSQS